MTLEDKLRQDVKEALKKGEPLRVSVLRLALSAMNYASIAKRAPLTESDMLGVLAKEVKQRQESIDAFQKGGRQDLADKEAAEKVILLSYLPQQMSHDEIVASARIVIAELGAKSPQEKGKVMQKLVAQLKGRADGRDINAAVMELLQDK